MPPSLHGSTAVSFPVVLWRSGPARRVYHVGAYRSWHISWTHAVPVQWSEDTGTLRTLMRFTLECNRLSEPRDNYEGITAPRGVASADPPPSVVSQKQRVKDVAALVSKTLVGRSFYMWKCMCERSRLCLFVSIQPAILLLPTITCHPFNDSAINLL